MRFLYIVACNSVLTSSQNGNGSVVSGVLQELNLRYMLADISNGKKNLTIYVAIKEQTLIIVVVVAAAAAVAAVAAVL
ncbi:uncharacterized protein A4U43_C05F33620 [Asparagus officinalis]|uniref:Uncharacterized protein n=1 Tax=Asparagus officinalis TaxID=4686 RepID=A0A5P1EZ36_ASPOF|nr:uncharacterized protein A4U43_C05F33620 [Asparagus officinalis]